MIPEESNLSNEYGLQCPRCMQSEQFRIVTVAHTDVYDDYCDSEADASWEPCDECMCKECDYTDVVEAFEPYGIADIESVRRVAEIFAHARQIAYRARPGGPRNWPNLKPQN